MIVYSDVVNVLSISVVSDEAIVLQTNVAKSKIES